MHLRQIAYGRKQVLPSRAEDHFFFRSIAIDPREFASNHFSLARRYFFQLGLSGAAKADYEPEWVDFLLQFCGN